jgi:hypothetical protein
MHQSNDEKRSAKKRIYRSTWNYEKKIEEYEEIFRLYKRKENPYELVFKLGHLHRASSRLPVVIDFTLIEQEIRNARAHLGYIRYMGNSLERGVNEWPKK